jgi:uncharacterized membrane protein
MKLYELFITSLVFISLDSVYLKLSKDYFKSQIKRVQGSPLEMNIVGLLLCYTFLVFGFHYFVIEKKMSLLDSFWLGILIYSVYELTNYALFTNWSFMTVIIDTLWGGVLFFLAAFVITRVRKLLRNVI